MCLHPRISSACACVGGRVCCSAARRDSQGDQAITDCHLTISAMLIWICIMIYETCVVLYTGELSCCAVSGICLIDSFERCILVAAAAVALLLSPVSRRLQRRHVVRRVHMHTRSWHAASAGRQTISLLQKLDLIRLMLGFHMRCAACAHPLRVSPACCCQL